MKRYISILLLVILLTLTGCAAHIHKIGNGGTGRETIQARQWYFLALVPLNTVDTNEMAGNATDYTIKTEVSPMDIVLGMFTEIVGINSRTVTVTK